MGLAEIFRKSLSKRWCIRIKTNHPDGDNYDGVIILIKDQYIVLHEVRELEFDGILILPKRFIKGYRDSKYELCLNNIIRSNGEIKNCGNIQWLNSCNNLNQIIKKLLSKDIWPGIEILYDNKKRSAFYIGPIIAISDHCFTINCYDAAGKWEYDYTLKYDEIIRIEIESRYNTSFNNYMRKYPIIKSREKTKKRTRKTHRAAA